MVGVSLTRVVIMISLDVTDVDDGRLWFCKFHVMLIIDFSKARLYRALLTMLSS